MGKTCRATAPGIILAAITALLTVGISAGQAQPRRPGASKPVGTYASPKTIKEIRLFQVPRGGTDRLDFITWDTIEVLGKGEDTVQLSGYYVIDRSDPTSGNWKDAEIKIAMRELSVSGVSQKFGALRASVNRDIGKQSGGRVMSGTFRPGIAVAPKKCVMEGYMKFELPDAGLTVFNKEPIPLEHFITHVPPIGQGGGTPGVVQIGLYNVKDPDGSPVAILKEVKTHIGPWRQ